jgi:hypothetical protein
MAKLSFLALLFWIAKKGQEPIMDEAARFSF